jgi:tyrosinase
LQAPKHILGQAYKVNIFLGEFDPDTTTWHTQDALVGTIAVFGKDATAGSENETGCGKCKTDAKKQVVVTGTVPLTAQIISVRIPSPHFALCGLQSSTILIKKKQEVKKGNCPSLDKANVIPWLTKNLHWRISLADGTERPATDVPGLVVALVTTDVNIPVGGRPQYSGVYESHPQVTAGRAGGS